MMEVVRGYLLRLTAGAFFKRRAAGAHSEGNVQKKRRLFCAGL